MAHPLRTVDAATGVEPSRRERRRLEIRDRIAQAAQHLFETQGYEATTVNSIAQRADIAYGTFFNHFPSKLDLLRELADLSLRDLFRDLEELSKQPGSFADHFVTLFEQAAESAVAMGPRTRELMAAMMALTFPQSADTDDVRFRLAFRAFLNEGLAAGEIRDDVGLDTLTDVVVGTWYSMYVGWVHQESYPLRERAREAGRFLALTLAPDSRLS